MNVFMPSCTYWVLAGASVLAVIGAWRAVAKLNGDKVWTNGVLQVWGLAFGLVLLSFLQLNTTVFQAQGRYLYPAVVPISLIWVLGVSNLFAKKTSVGWYVALVIPALVQIVALACCVMPGLPSP
jgi:O-antigen/teichoic acid export membrane protein